MGTEASRAVFRSSLSVTHERESGKGDLQGANQDVGALKKPIFSFFWQVRLDLCILLEIATKNQPQRA
jgi:hypothetical protein